LSSDKQWLNAKALYLDFQKKIQLSVIDDFLGKLSEVLGGMLSLIFVGRVKLFAHIARRNGVSVISMKS
jgi:hypothetical protein